MMLSLQVPMYEISRATPYRIMLAVSIALLIHTLAGLFLEKYRIPSPRPQKTIQFELVRSGDQPNASQATISARPRAESASGNHQEPVLEKPRPQPQTVQKPLVTTQSSLPERAAPTQSKTEKPVEHPNPASHRPAPAQRPKTHASNSQSSKASTQSHSAHKSKAGAHTLPSNQGKTSGITELNTHQDKPLSAYERILWEHIAQRVRFAPFMQDLRQVRTVRLQLDLMSNGALEAVRVIRSSGDPAVDAAARHATLLASPYPPPPASHADNGYRFQVELQFTPAQGP